MNVTKPVTAAVENVEIPFGKSTCHRYLVDSDALRAGLGHLMASFNICLKVASRNDLKIAPGLPLDLSWPARLRMKIGQIRSRFTSGSRAYDHESSLHDLYQLFLMQARYGNPVDKIWREVRKGNFKLVDLPEPDAGTTDEVRYARIDEIIRSNPGNGVVFRLPGNRLSRCDGDYGATRSIVRKLYFDARKIWPVRPLFEKGKISVAINIRRGDIVTQERFRNRLLPDAYFCGLIDKLCEIFGPERLSVIVFSERGPNGVYVDENCIERDWSNHPCLSARLSVGTHLDEEEWLEAIHGLITADILITSKSGFSHMAAVLNDNVKLAVPMWEPLDCTPHVITVDPDSGSFDEAALMTAWESVSGSSSVTVI